jgi:glutamyl-tRNA synthetase
MGITHVMRGDDHLNNAFRQKVIFDAMGWDLPAQAHLPLLHGEDGAKFSKRHGALGVMDYAAQGYLREAMINILLRMGWSHGDEEVISLEQATQWFDTDAINRSPARFDIQKLNHLNTEWIKALDDTQLMQRLLEFKANDSAFSHVGDIHRSRLVKAMPDLKERATTLIDLANDALIYIADENNPLHFDDKALKNIDADHAPTLSHLHTAMSHMDQDYWTHEALDALLKETAQSLHDGKFGKVGMPLRAALTGRTNSAGHANVMCALGRDETLRRLRQAIDMCSGTLPEAANS